MVSQLSQNWWILALRGVVLIILGILAFRWPSATALAFVYLLAAFAFIEGIFALVGAFGYGLSGSSRFLLVLIGLLGLAVGVAAVIYPGIAAVTVVLLVAWWAILTGVMSIVVAIEMRKVIPNDWVWVLSGILAVVFGILLIYRPWAGVLTLTWLFGFYALLYGILMIALAFRVKSLATAPL